VLYGLYGTPVLLSLDVAWSLGVRLCCVFDVGLVCASRTNLALVSCVPPRWGATHDPTLSLSVLERPVDCADLPSLAASLAPRRMLTACCQSTIPLRLSAA